MSVEDLDKVDLVSLGPDGRWLLTVLDPLDWTESRTHQYKLQKKLNAYMKFIESGQLVGAYPDAKGKDLVVDLQFLHMPDEDGWKFLERVRGVVEGAGLQIQCKLIEAKSN